MKPRNVAFMLQCALLGEHDVSREERFFQLRPNNIKCYSIYTNFETHYEHIKKTNMNNDPIVFTFRLNISVSLINVVY